MEVTNDHRVLVVAPTGGDSKNVCAVLEKAQFRSLTLADVTGAAMEIRRGCGALIITDEALHPDHRKALQIELERQPAWSNLPVILITSGGRQAAATDSRRGFDPRFHITLLERPLRSATLVASTEAALGSRDQQYKIRDLITERDILLNSLENRVAERTNKLQSMVEEMEAFSYSVSHDLRAPLRVLYGYAEVIQEDYSESLPAEARELLGKISNAAKRMDRLTQDLLAYTRIANGHLHLEDVDLDEIVSNVIESYPTLLEAKDQITIKRPLGHCFGHGPSLSQCFSNLLENSLKFTRAEEKGHVTVATQKKAGRVRIKIADNGIGIDPRHQERIFGLFERADGRASGTGIGLSIVKKAVERMHGKVQLESVRGKGTTFWIELNETAS